ncbi:MAG: hypothetical protein CMH83_11255 [Nocardioides sp.]|nr:hypothetical protein [Nocardioides sp.]
MTWQLGTAFNLVIAVAYLFIAAAVVLPLARSQQLRSNPLGAATAGIFFTCAVHHGSHAVHMLLPALGVDDQRGLAMREAWDWPLTIWDAVGAAVAVYYWTLRRTYSSLMEGAQLFEDLRRREQQALELNDSVLQGLVVAKMALDLGDEPKARQSLDASIDHASRIITGLLDSKHFDTALLRSAPAATALDDSSSSAAPSTPATPPAGSDTASEPTEGTTS